MTEQQIVVEKMSCCVAEDRHGAERGDDQKAVLIAREEAHLVAFEIFHKVIGGPSVSSPLSLDVKQTSDIIRRSILMNSFTTVHCDLGDVRRRRCEEKKKNEEKKNRQLKKKDRSRRSSDC